MDKKTEWKKLTVIIAVFLGCFFLPVGRERFDGAIMESLHLAKWYAREHVLLCLIPAFFIAGAIGVFVSQASVMKYLGAKANKVLAYGVASVSGTILAVCSCTILPLFAGIYKMGAGLGPATAFTFRLATTELWYGVLLLTMYGLGHCAVIVFAGTCTEAIQRYLNWNEASKGATVVKTICGILVLLGGLYMLYIA